jgi:hypothetical protein
MGITIVSDIVELIFGINLGKIAPIINTAKKARRMCCGNRKKKNIV